MVVAGGLQVRDFAVGHFYLHFAGIGNCSDSGNRHRIIPLFQQLTAIVFGQREKQLKILAVVDSEE